MVSSPTLAQGLNLSATAIIVFSLYRSGQRIGPSEFKNVIGRAGRAFVDMQGVVLYPIYEAYRKNRSMWCTLVKNTDARSMESGLVLLVIELLKRMGKTLGINFGSKDINLGSKDFHTLMQHVLSNVDVWEFPPVDNEGLKKEKQNNWRKHIVSLDTALLSLLGSDVEDINDIPAALDTILSSSLWARQLA